MSSTLPPDRDPSVPAAGSAPLPPPSLPGWDHPPSLPSSFEPAVEAVRVPWHWAETFVVFIFSLVTFAIVAAIIASTIQGDLGKSVTIVAFGLSLAFWSVTWVKIRFGLGFRILGFRGDQFGRDVGQGLIWGALGWLLATLVVGNVMVRIVDALSSKPVDAPDQLDLSDPSAVALAITAIGVVIIAPLAEEMFFRGFVFQALRRRWPLPLAGIASGAVFMLAHVPFWIIFPSIFTLGLVLAWLFERRGSIVPCIVAHSLFNLVGFAAYLTTL